MAIPNVIYVIRDSEDGELYAYDRQPFTTTPAYIRKESILEWAETRKKVIEVNGDEDDAFTRGEYSVLDALIDKLNQL